jgi:hypothetical protein
MAHEVKQNQASKTSFIPPELWLQHKELGIKIEQFTDAPMHMLFLGITKHLLAHVVCLFGNKNANYQFFLESYLSISNMATTSLLIGVPLLIFQKLNQYQPLVGNLLSMLLFHNFPWFILD